MRNAVREMIDWTRAKGLANELWAALKVTPPPGGVDVSKHLKDKGGRSTWEKDQIAARAIMYLQQWYPNALTVIRDKKNLTLLRTPDFEAFAGSELQSSLKQSNHVVKVGTDLIIEP